MKILKIAGLNILLALLIVGAILGGLMIWLRSYTQHGIEIVVSDVRGMLVSDATPLLEAQGLKLVVVDSTYSSEVPLGSIVEQDPRPSRMAKNGRSVYVTINASTTRQVTMPNLLDMSPRQVVTSLRGMGLVVDSLYEYQPSTFSDLVLDIKKGDQSIMPGEKIEVGSKVRLVVGYGKGEQKVRVPNVMGLSAQDARSLILRNRLIVGTETYDAPLQEDEEAFVYEQTPIAGEECFEGETVNLKLSVNKEKALYNNAEEVTGEDWF